MPCSQQRRMPDSKVLGSSSEGVQLYTMASSDRSGQKWGETRSPKLFSLSRCSPSAGQRRRAVLETKLWQTKAVCFLVLVSMLILQMISCSKLCGQIWWQVLICFEHWTAHISGFHMLTQQLSHGVLYWRGGSKERLQQMFLTSTKEELDGVKSFTESYLKYKREYVKHLNFNPKEGNLSKCIFVLSSPFASSFCAGSCATGGSVHLLWHSNLWWDWEGWEGELF